jgi:hypothetical protein
MIQRKDPRPVEDVASRQDSPDTRWRVAGIAFCVLMLGVHVAAGWNSAGVADFWRDMYWATSIAHGERFPLAGPQIYQLIELGPWWFYLLALPMIATGSVAMTMVFIQALAALKYFLAWRIGVRIADARLGLAFAASLAIAGWSTVPLLFPSHTAVVETTILLLVLVAWRCARTFSLGNAIWLGLASAACLHAHPTTASYVVGAGVYVLWRQRSWSAWRRMCVAATIAALTLLPPWLDRGSAIDAALKPISAYVGADIGVHPLLRIPTVAHSLVTGGAWWGLLLLTPWKAGTVRFVWWIFCCDLALAAMGFVRLRRDRSRLCAAAGCAGAAFALQIAFIVVLRPITPMWMASSCLPPLALVIAIGWYGWLSSPRRGIRLIGAIALCVYVAIGLAPFSLLLRDLRSLRVMPGVNPWLNVSESSARYVHVAVPFYPIRRIDRLSASLCGPMVLHARLAAEIEPTFGSPIRNACGHWPDLRYGGVEGPGQHAAGLFRRAATASGIAPARVVSRMAIYDRVRAIAPASGGRSAALRRLQIYPDSGAGPIEKSVFDFDTAGDDVVVLTNLRPYAAPLAVDRIFAAERPARQLNDDGGSILYRCAACTADAPAHWHIELHGIAANLDLVVLLHDAADAAIAPPR